MTVSRKKAVKDRIKDVVRYIWMNEIRREFENGMLMGDSSFVNAFYYYLRDYLKYEIKRDDLRIYTGHYIRAINDKADITITYMDNEKLSELKKNAGGEYYNAQDALEVLAVFKLKYLNYAGGADEYVADIENVKNVYSVTKELSDSEYYMCFISEFFYNQFSWVDSAEAEKYNITELTAVWDEEESELIWHAY